MSDSIAHNLIETLLKVRENLRTDLYGVLDVEPIQRATKLVVPDGSLIEAASRVEPDMLLLNPPYPYTLYELDLLQTNANFVPSYKENTRISQIVALCRPPLEEEKRQVARRTKFKPLHTITIYFKIGRGFGIPHIVGVYTDEPVDENGQFSFIWLMSVPTHLDQDTLVKQYADCASFVFATNAMLRCNNIDLETQPAPDKLNKKRLKKNKEPVHECKILNVGGVSINRSGNRLARRPGTTTRFHMVRGHIRRLGEGRTTWVSAHSRGDPSLGSVTKSYQMRR